VALPLERLLEDLLKWWQIFFQHFELLALMLFLDSDRIP
jgi:hypothetical protein